MVVAAQAQVDKGRRRQGLNFGMLKVGINPPLNFAGVLQLERKSCDRAQAIIQAVELEAAAPTVEGIARRLTDAEVAAIQANEKLSLSGRLWHKIYELRGRIPVYCVITPAEKA